MPYSRGGQPGSRPIRAIICNQPFELMAVSRPEPSRQNGEVLIRIRRVGLCGTDYHIYAGKHPYLAYHRVSGHELAGEVVAADSRSSFRPGQLVTINPYLACGECRACRLGKPNCCVRLQVLGVHTDGGMCDELSVPESAVIDASGLSLDQAAMVEFLSIGAPAARRASLSDADQVLVVGAGPIGIAVAWFARLQGAAVTLMDVSLARLEFARERLGFERVIQVSASAADELSKLTSGDMFDCVFDATGNITAMKAGLDYVAHGGRYVLVGVAKDEIAFSDPEFHKRETTLLASRNALNEDFDHVILQIAAGAIPTQLLHTHSIAAGDTPRQLPELIGQRDSVLKAIVIF